MSISTSTLPRQHTARAYLTVFLLLTVGAVWLLTAVYIAAYPVAVKLLGPLDLSNPVVMTVLNSPAIAACVVLAWYGGPRAFVNFARTLIPRRRDVAWLVGAAVAMIIYVFAVRVGCQLVGISVPATVNPPLEMAATMGAMLWRETGMLAIAFGFYAVLLPLLLTVTRNRYLAGLYTGLALAVFVAPGNLFSSFDLATAWPLYAAQLCLLSIAMSFLLGHLKGNVLAFLVPFWVSASGSANHLYYFKASTQLVQLALFAFIVAALVAYLRRADRGHADELITFPAYLEHDYTSRVGAPLPGVGDHSRLPEPTPVAPAPVGGAV